MPPSRIAGRSSRAPRRWRPGPCARHVRPVRDYRASPVEQDAMTYADGRRSTSGRAWTGREHRPPRGGAPRSCPRADGHLRDQVGRDRPAQASQHGLGQRQVRGAGAATGRPVGGRLRRRARERIEARPRRARRRDARHVDRGGDVARSGGGPRRAPSYLRAPAACTRLAGGRRPAGGGPALALEPRGDGDRARRGRRRDCAAAPRGAQGAGARRARLRRAASPGPSLLLARDAGSGGAGGGGALRDARRRSVRARDPARAPPRRNPA